MLAGMGAETGQNASWWVRLADEEVVDGEVEEPVPGAVMRSMAISIGGRREPLGADVFDGTAPADLVPEDAPPPVWVRRPQYVATGMLEQAEDQWADYYRGKGLTHTGTQLLLRMDRGHLYAFVDGWAKESNPLSRFPVRVRGDLAFVASYAWDAFNLTDIRSDWSVMEVVHLASHDRLVRVRQA